MHHLSPLISIIALGFLLSYLFGMLSQRFKLSPLVGYIGAGILLGPHIPFFYNADLELANELSEIGVTLLMFGVGLHFSVKDLNKVRNIAVPGAIIQIIATMILTSAILYFFNFTFFQAAIFGLCVSIASTVVLLRALEDNNLSSHPRGKLAIGWLVVEDLLTVVVLVIMPMLTFMVSDEPFSFSSFLIDLLITGVKVAGFLAVMFIYGRKVIPQLVSRGASTGSSELFLLSVLSISLGIAFLAALIFNVSYALGAFFAGMIIHESELAHRAEQVTQSLRDAFAVLFFVSVGMLFNFRILFTDLYLVLVTTFIIIIGKGTISYFIVKFFGQNRLTSLTIAVSLAQIGEFSFILVGLATNFNYIEPLHKDMILAGAIISIIANPFLFQLLDRYVKQNERIVNAAVKHPEFVKREGFNPLNWRDWVGIFVARKTTECVAKMKNHETIINPLTGEEVKYQPAYADATSNGEVDMNQQAPSDAHSQAQASSQSNTNATSVANATTPEVSDKAATINTASSASTATEQPDLTSGSAVDEVNKQASAQAQVQAQASSSKTATTAEATQPQLESHQDAVTADTLSSAPQVKADLSPEQELQTLESDTDEGVIHGASSQIPLTEEELQQVLDREVTNDLSFLRNHHIIVGYGELGSVLTAKMRRDLKQVVVITNDYDQLMDLNSKGIYAVFGDFKDLSVYATANLAKAATLTFSMSHHVYENASVSRKLLDIYPKVPGEPHWKSVAIALNSDDVGFLTDAGIDEVINIRKVASSFIVNTIENLG